MDISNNEKICFPSWKSSIGVPEPLFDEEIVRLKTIIGSQGEKLIRKKHDEILKQIGTFDEDTIRQHEGIMKRIYSEFMVDNGINIAPYLTEWLKEYLELFEKFQKKDEIRQRKRKRGIDTDVVRQARPDHEKSKNIITQLMDQEVPHYWWSWQMPRIFRLKVKGDTTKRDTKTLSELMIKWQLGMSFKVNMNPVFTWITLSSEQDRQILSETLMANGFTVEIPKWQKPKIKLKHLTLPIGDSWKSYIKRIMGINGFTDEQLYDLDEMVVFEMNNNTFGISMKISGYVRSMIETNLKGRLATGSSFIRVYDEFRIVCCKNCLKIGHPKCQTQPRCQFCGQNHSRAQRCETLYCSTCERGDHAAKSRACPLYKNAIQRSLADIDYSYKYLFM